MLVQKRKEQTKEFENQERRLRELKKSGKSGKQAVNLQFICTYKQKIVNNSPRQTEQVMKSKQTKKGHGAGKQNQSAANEAAEAPRPELVRRPKDYVVKFAFPQPPPLNPPILGIHSAGGWHVFSAH